MAASSSARDDSIRCRCGERFHVQPRDAGRRLRCRCGRTVEVPAAAPPPRARVRTRAARGGTAGTFAAAGRRMAMLGWHRAALARAVTVTTLAYLAIVCTCTVMLWWGGDRGLFSTLLLFAGRWVLLLPLAVLVPAAMLLAPRALVPLAGAALLVLFPFMGLRLGALGAVEGASLRVVSFNTAASPAFPPLLEQSLAEWGADVVLFQECNGALIAALDRLAGWHSAANGPLCIASRHRISDRATMPRQDLERTLAAGFGGSGFVDRYTIDTPRGPVRLGNLHLETVRKGLERYGSGDFGRFEGNLVVREAESRRAREWMRTQDVEIVAGDFNMPVESRIYREAWGDLTNAFDEAGRGFGYTRYNGWIRVRIDHVLHGDRWATRAARVLPDAGSDHRPVLAELVKR